VSERWRRESPLLGREESAFPPSGGATRGALTTADERVQLGGDWRTEGGRRQREERGDEEGREKRNREIDREKKKKGEE
jgi:hypothetical protein